MAPSIGHRARLSREGAAAAHISWRMWLAPVIGAVIIIGLAAAATYAQATNEIFLAASLLFSLCEGVVLAFVGFAWSGRGVYFAALAGAVAAALAAPGRWEFIL